MPRPAEDQGRDQETGDHTAADQAPDAPVPEGRLRSLRFLVHDRKVTGDCRATMQNAALADLIALGKSRTWTADE